MDDDPNIAKLLETVARLEQKVDELAARPQVIDPHRAYSDREVCALLGGISQSTLWRVRRRSKGLIESVHLFDDEDGRSRMQRTTGRQIIEYLKGRERAADVLKFTATGRRRRTA